MTSRPFFRDGSKFWFAQDLNWYRCRPFCHGPGQCRYGFLCRLPLQTGEKFWAGNSTTSGRIISRGSCKSISVPDLMCPYAHTLPTMFLDCPGFLQEAIQSYPAYSLNALIHVLRADGIHLPSDSFCDYFTSIMRPAFTCLCSAPVAISRYR